MIVHEIPVIKLGPLLLVSIQTELNDRVAARLQLSVLEKIQSTGASGLLIDIAALDTLDSYIGRVLSETARMARLMDARVVLVGMQPAVAITLLEMGLELPDVGTAMNMETGLDALGYRLASRSDENGRNGIGGEGLVGTG